MIHPSVKIHPSAIVECDDLTIGSGSVINAGCTLEGRRIVIGREAWLDVGAHIGGGSCHDPGAHLLAGDWLHMGRNSHVNTARGVTIGDEVGLGIETKVFTHGAYLSEWDGFPVRFERVAIGSRVWLPNAWVNPGVTIGDDVVVAARSLVIRDIPSGALAAGIPAQIVTPGPLSYARRFPRLLTAAQQRSLIEQLCLEINDLCGGEVATTGDVALGVLVVGDTLFDVSDRTIAGPVDTHTIIAKNQLRRHGIRFRYEERDGEYRPWQ